MSVLIQKTLAFAFWRLRAMYGAPENDSADWKVFGIIGAVGVGLAFTTMFFISMLMHCRLLMGVGYWILIAPIGVALMFGRPDVSQLQTLFIRYETEFRAYSARKRLAGSILVLAGILSVAVVTLYSGEQFRKLPKTACVQMI